VALGATRSHREGRTETGVTGWGGDGHARWRSGVSSCAPPLFLPPPRSAAETQNVLPMPGPEALLCAFGAVA
jgi:hypothetical protein